MHDFDPINPPPASGVQEDPPPGFVKATAEEIERAEAWASKVSAWIAEHCPPPVAVPTEQEPEPTDRCACGHPRGWHVVGGEDDGRCVYLLDIEGARGGTAGENGCDCIGFRAAERAAAELSPDRPAWSGAPLLDENRARNARARAAAAPAPSPDRPSDYEALKYGTAAASPDPERPTVVTLSEIEAQRAAGWPDFHPEDFCHRCGRSNIVWWVDSDLFNEAIGPEGIDPEWRGIVCPQCFVELSPLDTVWRLVPRERAAGAPSPDPEQPTEHALVVVPRSYDTVIWCPTCGGDTAFRLKYGDLPKHDGTPSITAADLAWWSDEHRAALGADPREENER